MWYGDVVNICGMGTWCIYVVWGRGGYMWYGDVVNICGMGTWWIYVVWGRGGYMWYGDVVDIFDSYLASLRKFRLHPVATDHHTSTS